MIDIGMLISMSQPDANGNLIPNHVQEGSVVFSNPKGRAQWMTVAVCGALYNPRKATSDEKAASLILRLFPRKRGRTPRTFGSGCWRTGFLPSRE
jgi:hypothetical protein